MRRIKELFIFCAGLLLCMACTKEYQEDMHLQTAMQTVDDNPQEALRLLDEIPSPELLDQDNYMRYVVTLTQARYMDRQDITGNTSILTAQHYFADKPDAEMAARASYYAAAYWHKKEEEDKALEYSLLAYYFARQAGNNLFHAKSAHWIGSAYYDMDILDSARVYYHQAEELYAQEANTELHQLDIKYMLGRTYRELEQYDPALNYFNEGLEMSRELHNQLYETRFVYNKGLLFREQRDFQQAKEYFNLALSKNPETEDYLRICLNYATLYRATKQPDSVKYYLNLVENRVNELSFSYNRVIAYEELSYYYEHEGNTTQMRHYLQLANRENKKISELQSAERIQAANDRFEAFQHKAERKYNRIWKIVFPVVIAFFFLMLFFRYDWHKMRLFIRVLREQYLHQEKSREFFLLENLIFINLNMYQLAQDQGIVALPHTPIYKRFQNLRGKVNLEIAGLVRAMLEKSSKGVKALSELNTEDLCIIFLCRWKKYTDDDIKRLMGYEDVAWFDVDYMKDRIRRTLAAAGMKEREIKGVFLSNI